MAGDIIKKFLLEDRSVRVIAVSLEETWQIAKQNQSRAPAVTTVLGELVACAAMITATLKFDGSLLLQLRGNGAVKLIVVECRNDHSLRATAKLRREPLEHETGLNTLLNADGLGHFSVILNPPSDTPGMQPYQGIVSLTGESVAQSLQAYMQQSEQLETRMWLSVQPDRLTGLLLQRMPVTGGASTTSQQQADASWEHAQALCETLSTQEMSSVDIDTLVHRLFWQTPIVNLDESPVTWRCGCTRERVASMLRALGEQEVNDIIQEQGSVKVTCEFCAAPYAFDAVDAASLFREVPQKTSDTLH
jgi:molecular chaperone Hsp33